MHAKQNLRVFLKWMIAGSGSVITGRAVLERSGMAMIKTDLTRIELFEKPRRYFAPARITSSRTRQQ